MKSNHVLTLLILASLVIALGSAVILRNLERGKEEVSTGDIKESYHISDVTIDGEKLVYKDNSVNYSKYVILDYIFNTNYYVEDTYYYFDNIEEYRTNMKILENNIVYYNPELLLIRTMSDLKEMDWVANLAYIKENKGTIIR